MPLTFPTIIKQEMTKQSSAEAFVLLFQIEIEGIDTVYLCRNNEDITFGGQLYTKWAIDIDSLKTDTTGQINIFNIRVDNTLRTLQQLIEQYDNLANSNITILVVHTGNLATAIPDFISTYKVKNVKFNQSIAEFELGSEDILRKRVPYRAYNKNRCPYIYKGIECGSTSALTECNRTLSNCRERNNSPRFGGEINIPDLSGVYV
ncbi:MAG: hypothetical protein ABIJ17_02535 [Patescibacteria group bacterium]